MYYYLCLSIIIIIIIYASLYYIFDDELIIYQVDASHFDFNLLYKKQPIIIQDSIKNIDEILVDWFNYNIIEPDVHIPNIWGWNRNNFKYLLIYAGAQEEDSVEITLGNPHTKHENNIPISQDMLATPATPATPAEYNHKLTTILLNKNKVLIIPFKWFYHISILASPDSYTDPSRYANAPRFFGIHDYVTYGLSVL